VALRRWILPDSTHAAGVTGCPGKASHVDRDMKAARCGMSAAQLWRVDHVAIAGNIERTVEQ